MNDSLEHQRRSGYAEEKQSGDIFEGERRETLKKREDIRMQSYLAPMGRQDGRLTPRWSPEELNAML
ncbi:hypothetical protein DHEL01_v211966 [Diaporthe helianthi]|uniref:Uncharacterized protein n=1 Tax=Diaporthe helianthi TaxID=158607 RepID=A0A2P5HHB3_DIAHE|nr:hypothetical protein DHEL01_v211966 [Diaporthe helianthi]